MYLCPEFEERQILTDQEFWERVYPQEVTEPEFDDPDIEVEDRTKCNVCGEYAACAYDSEGRPMTHIEPDDDDQSIS